MIKLSNKAKMWIVASISGVSLAFTLRSVAKLIAARFSFTLPISLLISACIIAAIVGLIWLVTSWELRQDDERRDFTNLIRSTLRRVALFVLFSGSVSTVIFLLWKVPEYQVTRWKNQFGPTISVEFKDLVQAENSARATIAQILGGLTLLIGLYFTGRNVRTAQEGQITDRFTKAIGQLGDTKLEVRLGGIYALERIANDSGKDRWAIMEILTAYVREHAKPDSQNKDATVSTDIQAILTALGRRKRTTEKWEYHRLDLRGVNLNGADLAELHFESATFQGATLKPADLRSSYFKQANLVGVNMEGASLLAAHLEGASLTDANLEGAWFAFTKLKGATLYRANLKGARLKDTHLTRYQIADAVTDSTTELPESLE